MSFNEDSRVKIPALVHLTRLGYNYISRYQKKHEYSFDSETNIITNVFVEKLKQLNPKLSPEQIDAELKNIKEELDFDDLGRSFYKRLIGVGDSDTKLIDWQNFNNNSFHITTELTCRNGEDEFRPDITVFINGLPLSFIEVKKPNNEDGIKAERNRINTRFKNDKFRRFINITQLIMFSNNMEYDDTDKHQLMGAFYTTTAKDADVKFNNFREQRRSEYIDSIDEIDPEVEDYILADNNAQVIKNSPEYKINNDIDTPTNRLISSLYSKDRLKFILKYAICYVDEVDEDTNEVYIQKHIMRYPQFFGTKAIVSRLDEGAKKGVIWHTQGSGKTALAYYSLQILRDHFSQKGIIPKFYFIVDRLSLATQASDEFSKRGVTVNQISDRKALIEDFKDNTPKRGGITVLNIHKFQEDTTVLNDSGYDIKVQRIFFIDEAHRSYDPRGSFLANLYNSDKDSIKIALTGTPLIIYKDRDERGNIKLNSKKEDAKTTRNIFGEYIHKYYYNDSIRDGYTLKLLREEIETSYKEKVRGIVSDIKIQTGDINKKDLYAHEKFAGAMLRYIINDFKKSRIRFGDKTIGGMVVGDSSDQARQMFRIFNETKDEHGLTSALILHDEGDKETRKEWTKDFKDGKIDLLFVYNMLLTGFDAPRLKKLYLGRKIRAHNLLQTLTRVNRPYKDFSTGYVVDFADISTEFEVINKAYFEELNREYGSGLDNEDATDVFGSLFMSKAEIDQKINEMQTVVADYSTDNLEKFSQQISEIHDKLVLQKLRNSLESAREVYNVARLLGYIELTEKVDIELITRLVNMVAERIKLLNLMDAKNDVSSKELLNTAIEGVIFDFTKIGEEELKLLSEEMHNTASKVRQELDKNFNKKDPEWIDLYEAFIELLNKHHINPDAESLENMRFESQELKNIFNKIKELNRKNSFLLEKFNGDRKFAIIFKKQQPTGRVSDNLPLYNLLNDAKSRIDGRLRYNQHMLDSEGYFRRVAGADVLESFETGRYDINSHIASQLTRLVADEYIEEFKGEN